MVYDLCKHKHVYEHTGEEVDLSFEVVQHHAHNSVGTLGRDLILAMQTKIRDLEIQVDYWKSEYEDAQIENLKKGWAD